MGYIIADLNVFQITSNHIFMDAIITAQNMAVRVSRVVMPIPTLPGTDSTEMNKDIQASVWNVLESNTSQQGLKVG